MSYIDDVFGRAGHLAESKPGYVPRAAQITLARAVDAAIVGGHALLSEAPTGTGKSLAYLAAASYRASTEGKRIVVVTANIALQEQLVSKDLPALAAAVPWKFSFALLKGRSNYLCEVAREQGDEGGLEAAERAHYDEIAAWAKTTEKGDRAELRRLPPERVWARFSVPADECPGKRCPLAATCFAERAKAVAHEADVIVTNYHVLFAHLAVRRATGADAVLPPFDAVIMDEAHEAAEIAREFCGFSVSIRAIGRLARDAQQRGKGGVTNALRKAGDGFFAKLERFAKSGFYTARLTGPVPIDLAELRAAIVAYRATEPKAQLADYATLTFERIAEGVSQAQADRVYWIELDAKGRAALKAKYIDVGGFLRRELFDATGAVVALSATLRANGSFGFARHELGAPTGACELVVESPFDFPRQALLVTPAGIPEPGAPSFPAAVADSVIDVIDHCDGRTLGLFTSYKNLHAVAQIVRAHRGDRYRILVQGEDARSELVRIFKEDTHSVLLGTESFWTGVDVPGEALTAVVIDKVPFPSPDDPVVAAKQERGLPVFGQYMLPKASMLLQQGVGRLIRSVTDHGVVVLLDPRLTTKGYGTRLLADLPPMGRSSSLTDISTFLGTHARRA